MPTTWFIARDGKQHGPITDPEFRKLVELGHLKETDYVWHDGAADWMPGTQFLDASPALTRAKPEPVPLPSAGPRSTELQEAAAPSALSSKRRIVIAAIGLVAMVVVGVLVKLATDKVLGGLFATNVDRAAIERQLLAGPKMRWLQILQEKQPQSYAQFMDALLVRLEKREPLEDSINYLRKSFVEPIFSANAPYLDDEAMLRYISLIADQMDAFAQKNPALCVRLLHGRPVGDVRPYLPESLQAQELRLLEDALLADKTKQRRWYTQAEQMKLMQGIVARLSQQHGDRVQLINPATPAEGRERDACTIGIALFREIAALPAPNSAALMRSLLGAAPK
jgi:GYF domain 2